MDELKHRPDPHAVLRREAAQAVRDKVRVALREALHDPPPAWSAEPQLEELEDAICRSLADREIAWALAYIAGVQMAPELLRRGVGS